MWSATSPPPLQRLSNRPVWRCSLGWISGLLAPVVLYWRCTLLSFYASCLTGPLEIFPLDVSSPSLLLGAHGLMGVTRVLLRLSCNFSAALEVSSFWQLSLADTPPAPSDPYEKWLCAETPSRCRPGRRGEPGAKPSHTKPHLPDLQLVDSVCLSYPKDLQTPLLSAAHLQIK